MLNDHGRDSLASYHRSDRIHDLAFVARADAARRLIEEQELRLQRVSEGHVKQFSLALREIARTLIAFVGKVEIAKNGIGFGAHGLVEMCERHEIGGLSLARKNRKRHVIKRGEVIEYGHYLEASCDSRLDALDNGGVGDVVAPEQDLA